jgi:hypothetical protein
MTVIAVALLILGGLLLVPGVGFLVARRRGSRGARNPRAVLVLAREPVDGVVRALADVSGRTTNPATLTAPLSGQPCLAWELTVIRVFQTEDGPGYDVVWNRSRSGDLAIGYELLRDGPTPPQARSGTVRIAAARVRLPELSSRPEPWMAHAGLGSTPHPPDPGPLLAHGLPAEAADDMRADPGAHRVTEFVLRTGDFVRAQQVLTNPARLPDPDADFLINPFSRERTIATVSGCLAPAFLLAAAAALIAGVILLP